MQLAPSTAVLLMLAGSLIAETAAPAPADVVGGFYAVYQPMDRYGLPSPENLAKLQPYLSSGLLSLLAEARREQETFAKEHPDEKPPFVDGDLFSSLFEGFRTFSIGKSEQIAEGRWRVPVSLSYWELSEKEAVKWSDSAIVMREGDRLVIDDFEFGGDWDFAQKGTLRENLKPAP